MFNTQCFESRIDFDGIIYNVFIRAERVDVVGLDCIAIEKDGGIKVGILETQKCGCEYEETYTCPITVQKVETNQAHKYFAEKDIAEYEAKLAYAKESLEAINDPEQFQRALKHRMWINGKCHRENGPAVEYGSAEDTAKPL